MNHKWLSAHSCYCKGLSQKLKVVFGALSGEPGTWQYHIAPMTQGEVCQYMDWRNPKGCQGGWCRRCQLFSVHQQPAHSGCRAQALQHQVASSCPSAQLCARLSQSPPTWSPGCRKGSGCPESVGCSLGKHLLHCYRNT